MSVYALYIQPYYDSFCEEYINIITINKMPSGPLSNFVSTIRFNRLSEFNTFNKCNPLCLYAIKTISGISCNNQNILQSEQVDDLINFLIENNYTINKDLTKLMNNDRIYLNNGRKLLFYINHVTS